MANSEILAPLQDQYLRRGGTVLNNVLSVQDAAGPSIGIQHGRLVPAPFPSQQAELGGLGVRGVGQDAVGSSLSIDAPTTLDSPEAGQAGFEGW